MHHVAPSKSKRQRGNDEVWADDYCITFRYEVVVTTSRIRGHGRPREVPVAALVRVVYAPRRDAGQAERH
jgi:hypothetical protein